MMKSVAELPASFRVDVPLACRLVQYDETRSRRFPSADDVLVVSRAVAASGINAQLVQLYGPGTEASYFLGVGLAVIAVGGLTILVGKWSRRRMIGIK
ncbi:hypothetical protein BI49514_01797 [Brevibacterium iodinum ATCC 49514]|uniref:Uncharacterized protein n=1 Tax=Brevibacterium iodinum ATCC 49514 TaxID=1255616 RepID=A0A2H1JAQ7_9MICO|nr:hypothetical protein [Brevibacterium iodinum]SMX84418.1 hypothetical protein BI49514_01797 [Brevibacterium iodinum ATCC 49514]SUW11096.1 Uncharacterised protein [Brevibacterium iodinum]